MGVSFREFLAQNAIFGPIFPILSPKPAFSANFYRILAPGSAVGQPSMAGGPFFAPDPAGEATPAYNADPAPHFATRCDLSPTTPLAWQICVNLRPFAVQNRLFGPFFAVFRAPRLPRGKFLPLQALKTLIFDGFIPRRGRRGLQIGKPAGSTPRPTIFAFCSPARRAGRLLRPFCPVFASSDPHDLVSRVNQVRFKPTQRHRPQTPHAEAWTTYTTAFVVQPSGWARKCPPRPWRGKFA